MFKKAKKEEVKNLFTKQLSQFELDQIYVKQSKINQISQHLFGDWSLMASALRDFSGANEKAKKDFYSFKEIDHSLKQYLKENDDWHSEKQKNNIPQENIIVLYFRFLFHFGTEKSESIYWNLSDNKAGNKLLNVIKEKFLEFKKQNNKTKTDFNEKEIIAIQDYLSSWVDLLHLLDTVYLEKDKKKVTNLDKDINFYNSLDNYREELSTITAIYNKSRNFILSKKNQKKKIKINFENSTLLDGWDLNKEKDNLTVLLRKKDKVIGWKYYLGVMNQNQFTGANRLFDYHIKGDESEKEQQEKSKLRNDILHKENNDDNFYEKMNYKQIAKPSFDIKTLIKINGTVERKTKDLDNLKETHFPNKIWRIEKTESYKKGDSFNINL